MALRACRLNRKHSLAHLDATGTVTCGARHFLGTLCGTGTAAFVAFFEAFDLDVFLRSLDGFLEADLHVVTKMLTALGTSGTTAAAEERSEQTAHAAAENISKIAKDIVHVRTGIALAFQTFFAILIIDLALAGIAQNFIGFRTFLEFDFGFRVALVVIRMPLHCQFAVRFLDFLFIGILADAQYLVIIFCHFDDSFRVKYRLLFQAVPKRRLRLSTGLYESTCCAYFFYPTARVAYRVAIAAPASRMRQRRIDERIKPG